MKGEILHQTDPNESKREHCIKPYERPLSKSRVKLTSSSDFKKNDNKSIKEKPTAIPIKTQKLLNKSYWEYYNKLKSENIGNEENDQEKYFCQIATGVPKSKKMKTPEEIIEESNTSQMEDKMELSLPEIRTLEQCSVLSTMINKTL